MTKPTLQNELHVLIKLSNPGITEQEFERVLASIPPNFNWNYFLERAISSNLAGHLLPFPTIAETYYPPFIHQKIKGYQQRIMVHSLQLLETVKILSNHFNAKGISHAFLKGCSMLIRGEARLKTRQVSDVDVLIDPDKQEQVVEILESLGARVKFTVPQSKWQAATILEHAPIQVVWNGLCIDVHIRLFRSEKGYHISTATLLKQLVFVPFEKVSIPLLSIKESQLFTILHAHKHLYSGGAFKVGSINDLYTIPWDELASLAKEWNALLPLLEMKTFIETWFEDKQDATFLGQTALYFLSGRKKNWREKIIFLKRRLLSNEGKIMHPYYYFFKLFPSKRYLNTNFGQGSYLVTWCRRFYNLFRF